MKRNVRILDLAPQAFDSTGDNLRMVEGKPFIRNNSVLRCLGYICRCGLPFYDSIQTDISVDQAKIVLPRLDIPVLQQFL